MPEHICLGGDEECPVRLLQRWTDDVLFTLHDITDALNGAPDTDREFFSILRAALASATEATTYATALKKHLAELHMTDRKSITAQKEN